MGKIVMLIDDDDDVREILRDFVEDLGYYPVVAANGRDALDAIGKLDELPCVILVDLMMPIMDGWEFIQVVGSDARLAGIPIVVSTSAPDRAPTGSTILPKPVDLTQFVAALRRLCNGAGASV